jgi:integration host factor subunit alpha
VREIQRSGANQCSKSGKTVTRVGLSDAVYRTKAGLTRTESSAMVNLVLKEITDAIAQGEAVKLSSFGTFLVRKKGQRIGRNPKTGVEVPIVARRVVFFKASALMKQKIRRKYNRRGGTSHSCHYRKLLILPNDLTEPAPLDGVAQLHFGA